MPRSPLRFGSFLAPGMFSAYAFLAGYVARRLGWPTEIAVGRSYERASDEYDICFICGLAYIELARGESPSMEPIVAPVLQGKRFGGRPIYFSDVIVRRDSPFYEFGELRGQSWCYNEPYSQSGYGITCYWLARLGETRGFFGRVVESGWHERSIELVRTGTIDASAIDCHVLALAQRERPWLKRELRVIASLGPSTIQPVTVARRLPRSLREELRGVFLEMNDEPSVRGQLSRVLIERFVPVAAEDYEDLRSMRQTCETSGLLALH